jgi:hypothetical protein
VRVVDGPLGRKVLNPATAETVEFTYGGRIVEVMLSSVEILVGTPVETIVETDVVEALSTDALLVEVTEDEMTLLASVTIFD